MKTAQENGRRLKNAYRLVQTAGQGIKLAADTGYKTGYFMAKHPEVETLKKEMQKNYLAIFLAFAGVTLGMLGVASIMSKSRQ